MLISPKLINIDGNRVDYKDEDDKKLLTQNYKTFVDASIRWGNSSSPDCLFKKKSSIKNTSIVDENGRFPTQLFTNLDDEKYKYVKNIKNYIYR